MKRRPSTVVPTTCSIRAAPGADLLEHAQALEHRRSPSAAAAARHRPGRDPAPVRGSRPHARRAPAAPPPPSPRSPRRRRPIRLIKLPNRQESSHRLVQKVRSADTLQHDLHPQSPARRAAWGRVRRALRRAGDRRLQRHALHGRRSRRRRRARPPPPRGRRALGAIQERAKDNVSLTSQHLYVVDGDLAGAGQDRRGRSRPTSRPNKVDGGQAREAASWAPRPSREYAAYAKARGALVDAMQRALDASRTETRQERRGARRLAHDLHRRGAARPTRPSRRPATCSWRRPTGSPSTRRPRRPPPPAPARALIIIVALLAIAAAVGPRRLGHALGRAPGQGRSASA